MSLCSFERLFLSVMRTGGGTDPTHSALRPLLLKCFFSVEEKLGENVKYITKLKLNITVVIIK